MWANTFVEISPLDAQVLDGVLPVQAPALSKRKCHDAWLYRTAEKEGGCPSVLDCAELYAFKQPCRNCHCFVDAPMTAGIFIPGIQR